MGEPIVDIIESAGDAEAMTESDLAAALGEPAPEAEPVTEPEPTAEAPEPEKFVYDYDGTHKEFESREELLAYDTGRKSNEIGQLRAKLEAFEKLLEGAGEQPTQQPQMNQEQQEAALLKTALQGTGIDLDTVDAGAYKTIVKMMENMLGLYDGSVAEKRYDALQGKVEKITNRAQQAEALNAAGIDIGQVKEVLEKHPSLKALSPAEQVAVIADLAKAQAPQQGTGESPNALRQALQPTPAGHVEGSVKADGSKEINRTSTEEIADQLNGSDKDFLRALGKATAAGGQMPWLQNADEF